MEKNVMSFAELMAYGEQHGVKSCYMRSRVQQNAVEISMTILGQMEELSGYSRATLIDFYIEKWAREAEVEWLGSQYEAHCEYIDFIEEFSKKKLEEFKAEINKPQEPKKKAKLVTFSITTRVIVNENEMPECEDEDAINAAIGKILDNPSDYIHFDNYDSIEDDTECPYDPESEN